MLTGYIGSVTFLRAVAKVHKALRAANPNLRYVCDPVLGDEGKLYVPTELVEVYRLELVPLAAVLTPNQFEAEALTGRSIAGLEDALAACLDLHALGPDTVLLTSLDLPTQADASVDASGGDANGDASGGGGGLGVITMLATIRAPVDSERAAAGGLEAWVLSIPRQEGSYTGTGDLTAALLLAHLDEAAEEAEEAEEAAGAEAAGAARLPTAMAKVAATVAAVIRRTREANGPGDRQAGGELRLVQSKREIEAPDTAGFAPVRVDHATLSRAQALHQDPKTGSIPGGAPALVTPSCWKE